MTPTMLMSMRDEMLKIAVYISGTPLFGRAVRSAEGVVHGAMTATPSAKGVGKQLLKGISKEPPLPALLPKKLIPSPMPATPGTVTPIMSTPTPAKAPRPNVFGAHKGRSQWSPQKAVA